MTSDAMIVAGRTQPTMSEVELLAEAIWWRDRGAIQWGQYGSTVRAYHVRGGDVPAETVAHPDAKVEAVRRQICEFELIQAIGRARLIRRNRRRPGSRVWYGRRTVLSVDAAYLL